MSVIMDIEWVDEGKSLRYLSQLAALRTDKGGNVTDRFSRIFAPPSAALQTWHPVAFNGYKRVDFLLAGTEKNGLRELAAWLQPDENVFLWNGDAKDVLETHWRQALSQAPPPVLCLRKPILRQSRASGDSYEVARQLGIELPSPKHRAENDVQVLLKILNHLGHGPKELCCLPVTLPDPPKILPWEKRLQRNRRILAEGPYNYVFTPDSRIFHTRHCACMLHAKVIQGTIYCHTAARQRVPCKICKPLEKVLHPQPAAPAKVEPDPNALVQVKLFDGTETWLPHKSIVGHCSSRMHPGVISLELLKKHRCIGKRCLNLDKYEDCAFWKDLAQKEEEERRAREEKRAAIALKRSEEQRLLDLREEFQSFVSCSDTEIEIVRVELLRSCVYRVFYVSENRFADKHLFPELYECVSYYHPGWRIVLKHIRDLDGHFVTIDEYHRRRKK